MFCGKLVAISGFRGTEKRNAAYDYRCDSRDCRLKAKLLPRPPVFDVLIRAQILVDAGEGTEKDREMLDRWGHPDRNGKRYQFLLSYFKASKDTQAGNFKSAAEEFLSLFKKIARM